MNSDDASVKVFNRGEDYEKGFLRGLAWMFYYYYQDLDEIPDCLKDFVMTETGKSNSNNI